MQASDILPRTEPSPVTSVIDPTESSPTAKSASSPELPHHQPRHELTSPTTMTSTAPFGNYKGTLYPICSPSSH